LYTLPRTPGAARRCGEMQRTCTFCASRRPPASGSMAYGSRMPHQPGALLQRPPRLFEVAREKMRTRHLSLRTEHAYLRWLRRYVAFHAPRHPRVLGPAGVEAFLTYLAVERKVSAATQSQALQALLFLYRQVLEIELPWLGNVTRATQPKRLP